jgi:hypothetical protein
MIVTDAKAVMDGAYRDKYNVFDAECARLWLLKQGNTRLINIKTVEDTPKYPASYKGQDRLFGRSDHYTATAYPLEYLLMDNQGVEFDGLDNYRRIRGDYYQCEGNKPVARLAGDKLMPVTV